ncbi:MAG TPA: chemotaxis protein CheA, partial [Fimbriiglobus sp.]
MNDVIREFLLETQENLAQLDTDLVTLEKDPTERETLARVFRTLHSVKGTAGFIGLTTLQSVAHAAESLLSRIRAGELTFDRPAATATLGVVDAVRQILAAVEKDGGEGSGDYSALIAELDRLRDKAGMPVAPPKPPVVVASPPPPAAASLSLVAVPVETPSVGRVAVTDSALRIDVGLLDKLMTIVGELVLARNQVMQFSSSQTDTAFLGTVQRLNLLTTELQTNVMKTRMQPIGAVWGKFPRVVRDLAVACGKQVRLDTEGQETELDKTIIEAIRDPLTHIVRNAVDHGIEPPDLRGKSGKPAEGRLLLRAYHEGGKVQIEVTDDGGGIDARRVKEKAVRLKVVSAEDAARMSDRELVNLVFLPGFSTADKVTQFSGRGVGMDVVRTNIEKIGGSVDLDSRPGAGTTLRMKIPLTLAIIPALTVTSGGERFCIPQVSLLELVRVEAGGTKRIESFHGAPVYRLRENLLPLVFLDEHLELAVPGRKRGDVHIVVLQADDRPFGLAVDAIHDTEEIVVKPLQKQLKGVTAFAGATIMGDGRVALILDVVGLAHGANILAETSGRTAAKSNSDAGRSTAVGAPLLIFVTTGGERMAVPLTLVSRLEEFPRAALERSGGRKVVQYRDEILPLVDVA